MALTLSLGLWTCHITAPHPWGVFSVPSTTPPPPLLPEQRPSSALLRAVGAPVSRNQPGEDVSASAGWKVSVP